MPADVVARPRSSGATPGEVSRPRGGRRGTAGRRHFLMCPPDHFEVTYAINPWMDVSVPVDRARAARQWRGLRDTYLGLGHRVSILPPVPGLPDMVFAANGALVVDGRALVARFAHPQRRAEAVHHLAWLRANLDPHVRQAMTTNEAEGDLLVAGAVVLAGTGFRTDPASHDEVAVTFGREVVTLELVNPRFYHLDVALAVLDDATIGWFPDAFAPASRREITRRFPDAIEVSPAEADLLACNAVSDGRHVVLDGRAEDFARDLASVGFVPVAVEVDEFAKAGGGVKCLTQEVRSGIMPASPTTGSTETIVVATGSP